MYAIASERNVGFASRLNASAKLWAVTGAPVWKRNVFFNVKL